MCGISGYISDKSFDGAAMAKTLNHRGPDDFGEYADFILGKNVYLAHNRLSIIDLSSAGHQPMFSADRQVAIVYNGEVYNFEALRAKYLKDTTFRSKSDTEVILYLYQKLGIEFLKELNGDFAIAILDKHLSKLFLIRDRFGVKPLYYYYEKNTLVFASEIKAILTLGVKKEIDKESLQNYFVFKYVPGNKTLFKNINRVPPGHFLEVDIKDNSITENAYWQLNKNTDYQNISYTDAKLTLRNLLHDASNIRLISDVPVGTFFSGGIDSSIIAWFLKDRKDIIHYTAKKEAKDLKKEGTTSDYDFASQLASKWSLNLVPINISSEEANADLIKKTLFYSDDLIADGSQIPSYLITKEAKKTSTVMLSGMGADELFFGYKSHQLVLLSSLLDKFPGFFSKNLAKIFENLNQGKGLFKSYRRHLHQFGKYYLYPGKERYGMFDIVGDYNNATAIMNEQDEPALGVFKKYFDNDNDVFDNETRFECDNFLVKNLHYVDRMCMANAVEGRVPFLDHRIAELAYSLPTHYKISSLGKTKMILKEAFSDVLPSELINRRKAGFGMPLRSIFSNPEKIYELLDINFFASFIYFNVAQIKAIVNSHVSGREDNSALIYALISYQLWHKLWFEGE